MSDNNWNEINNGSSSCQLDLDGFNSIKKQILWTSGAQFVLVVVDIAFLIWYLLTPESSLVEHILFIALLFGGIFVIGLIHTKFANIKKRKFKEIVVREELSKKCELQAYLHTPTDLDAFPLAMIILAFNHTEYNYVLSDYIKGKYFGYPFRIIDLEMAISNNSAGNVHLITIKTKRRFEKGYLHLAPYARFFSNFKKIDSYANTPFFMHQGIEKIIMACEVKKAEDYCTADAALDLTLEWENARIKNTLENATPELSAFSENQTDFDDNFSENSLSNTDEDDSQFSAEPTYGPNDILTDSLASILLETSKQYKQLNLHFEGNLITICYLQPKDLFEPHLKYGLSSREKVGICVQNELDKSFALFDELRPIFDSLSLK